MASDHQHADNCGREYDYYSIAAGNKFKSRTSSSPSSPQPQDDRVSKNQSLPSLLPFAGLLFLSFSVASSAYSSRHDPPALSFVLFCYVDLLSLFFCLRSLEKLGPSGRTERRSRLKMAIWALATALNLAFAWRVSLVMPWLMATIIWSLAAAVAMGGFYGMFVYEAGDVVDSAEDEPTKGFSHIPVAGNV